MSYFFSIVTSGNQPNFDTTAKQHTEKLNNYLITGSAVPNSQLDKLNDTLKTVLPKKKEVKSCDSFQVVNNMTIQITTILCCEDENYEEREV